MKNKYYYDILFDADARNNYKDTKELANKLTIEDILKAQRKSETLIMMNCNEITRNIYKPNLKFLYQ